MAITQNKVIRVPFISGLDSAEHEQWKAELNRASAPITLCNLSELSEQERKNVAVALVANPDPSELATLPNLVWVQSLWAGVEKLVSHTSALSIKLVRLVDQRLSETMAEAALAWTLYLHRDMPRYQKQQAQRQWRQHPVKLAKERSVAVLGMGALGKNTASKLSDAGFMVRGWSKNSKSDDALPFQCFSGEDGLQAVLQASEIVIVLLPLTRETSGLLNTQRLLHLPKGASIINFARGPIIDDEALLANLNSGQLGHAVLDVFATEPLPEDHPYWTHSGITVLPHIAAPTDKTSASKIVARNLADYFDNGIIPASISNTRGY